MTTENVDQYLDTIKMEATTPAFEYVYAETLAPNDITMKMETDTNLLEPLSPKTPTENKHSKRRKHLKELFRQVLKNIKEKKYTVISNPRCRSVVWEVFKLIVDENKKRMKNMAYCSICKQVFRMNNNSTSNLVHHKCVVERIHNLAYKCFHCSSKFQDKKILLAHIQTCKTFDDKMDLTSIAMRMNSGFYTYDTSRNPSVSKSIHVLNVIDNSSQRIPNVFCCRFCCTLMKYTTNPSFRHPCIKMENIDNLPFRFTNDSEKLAPIAEKLNQGIYMIDPDPDKSDYQWRTAAWFNAVAVLDETGQDVNSVFCCKFCRTLMPKSLISLQHICNKEGPFHVYEYDGGEISTSDSRDDVVSNFSVPQYHINSKKCPSYAQRAAVCQKLKAKLYTLGTDKPYERSVVWDYFVRVIDETGNPLVNTFCCKLCLVVLITPSTTTSQFLRHQCVREGLSYSQLTGECETQDINQYYDIEDSDHEGGYEFFDQPPITTDNVDLTVRNPNTITQQAEIAFAAWLVEDCVPLDVIEGAGFRKLVDFLLQTGKLPDVNIENLIPKRENIEHNLISTKTTEMQELKADLKACRSTGVAVTAHIRQDKDRDFSCLGLTINYIASDKCVDRTLAIQADRCLSTDGLASQVNDVFQTYELNLAESYPVIVSPKGSQLFDALPSYPQINCISTLLNEALGKSIASCKIMSETLRNLSRSARTCSQSWRKILKMLDAAEFQAETANNREMVGQLKDYFANFKKVIDFFEGRGYPTIHMVHPYLRLLQNVSQECSADSYIMRDFKRHVRTAIDSHVVPNLSDLHRVATALFPPARRLTIFSEVDCKKTHQLVKDQMLDIANSIDETVSVDNVDLLDVVMGRNDASVQEKVVRRVNDEFLRYLSDVNNDLQNGRPLLGWWASQREELPILYKLSRRVLVVPASSGRVHQTLDKIGRWSDTSDTVAEAQHHCDVAFVGDIAKLSY